METIIRKRLESIRYDTTDKSFQDVLKVIDLNMIHFVSWVDEILKDDPDWFNHNTMINTYQLFLKWKQDGSRNI